MSIEGYWVSPSGKVTEVKTSHIDYMLEKPQVFGMTKQHMLDAYDKYDEKIGLEGSAREELMLEAVKKGWVRVRTDQRSQGLNVQVWYLDDRTKMALLDMAIELVGEKHLSKNTEIRVGEIKTQKYLYSDFEELLKGKGVLATRHIGAYAKIKTLKELFYLNESAG